jgi:hypothetical protein
MKNVILLGNGINNLSKNRKSWDDLLNDIIGLCDKTISSKDKSLPILYEEAFLKAARSIGKSEKILKEEIANIIAGIDLNPLHEQLLKLNVSDILTTNYDYALEDSLRTNGFVFASGNKSELEFNIFRHNEINNKRLWHIHGDISRPQSIVLGFDHYCRQTHQIENYLTTRYKGKFPVSFIDRFNENLIANDSWIDLFFTTNIHIVGLGLGFEETDLWWLLTQRARLRIENKLQYSNTITYYEPRKFMNKIKNDMFKAVDVEVIMFDSIDEDYYNELINNIQKQIDKTI